MLRYNDGRYNATGSYETGQHCWDNECHNGTISICDQEHLCNNPEDPHTSSPHPDTPGSGLECWYGWISDNNNNTNLTTAICDKNETLCISVKDLHSGDTWYNCHDPHYQDGNFNQSDVCYDDAIFCYPGRHDGKILLII